MANKLTQILALISAIAVIFVNYLATTGAIGGITPNYLSDKYPTYITPATYAFSIWALIYIGIILYSLYQLFASNSEYLKKTRTFFILSCTANIGWIYAWHNQYLGLSVIAMLILLSSLVLMNLETRRFISGADLLLVKVPFSIYFGWVSIATVLNIVIFLISMGIVVSDNTSNVIACVIIVIVTIIGIFIREKFHIGLYSLTLAWAITAIAVKQSGKTAIVLTSAFAVMTLIFSSLTFLLKDKSNSNE